MSPLFVCCFCSRNCALEIDTKRSFACAQRHAAAFPSLCAVPATAGANVINIAPADTAQLVSLLSGRPAAINNNAALKPGSCCLLLVGCDLRVFFLSLRRSSALGQWHVHTDVAVGGVVERHCTKLHCDPKRPRRQGDREPSSARSEHHGCQLQLHVLVN